MAEQSPMLAAGRRLLITSRMPVRWGDMDAYGHVNNTVYFRYLEQTRVEWLEQMGSAVSPDNAEAPVIINAACTFMLPVNYPATVIVRRYGAPAARSCFSLRPVDAASRSKALRIAVPSVPL